MDDGKLKPYNPHHICSLDAEANCVDCGAHKDVNCRFRLKDLMQFYSLFLPFAIFAIIGVRQSGYGAYLFGWIVMAIVFLGFGRSIFYAAIALIMPWKASPLNAMPIMVAPNSGAINRVR